MFAHSASGIKVKAKYSLRIKTPFCMTHQLFLTPLVSAEMFAGVDVGRNDGLIGEVFSHVSNFFGQESIVQVRDQLV
jgi:hypothetical protein